jgi:hypothetical protein
MRRSARHAPRKMTRYRFQEGWGTSPSAVLRSKRSSKNMCAAIRGFLIAESQTPGIPASCTAPWSQEAQCMDIRRWSRVGETSAMR